MRNSKIKIYWSVVGFVGVMFLSTACQDFFDLERPPENPWLTLQDFERAPIGAYGVLFSSHEWVQSWSNYAVTITSLGDDVEWVRDNKWNYWRNTDRGFSSTGMTDRHFYLIYRGLGAINNALDFVEDHEGNPYPNVSPDDKEHQLQRIIGELHFLRAFCYYSLQTIYGHAYVPGGNNSTPDLPIPTSFAGSAEEAINQKIGTTQEVWDLIRDDLEIAKALLPEKYINGLHHRSYEVRANKFAAVALLMRTYFQRGEYDLAAQEADFIIDQNDGAYDLSEDPIEAFNKSGFAQRGRETIWYLPYSDIALYPDNHLSVLNATWDGRPCTWPETRMAGNTLQMLDWKDQPDAENDTTFNESAVRDKRFRQLMLVRYPVNVMLKVLGKNGFKQDFNLSNDSEFSKFENEIALMNDELGTHYQIDNRDEIRNVTTLGHGNTIAAQVRPLPMCRSSGWPKFT
ncbi:MAG: hypothetical protein HC819_07095 [Cyclobacteriaceae bacterium]|nr:hypothetical protein [Cyclobacteriaceae bacterium]